MFISLFRTCRGGRDLALRSARKAVLALVFADQEPDAAWERQLRAARQALGVRGKRPTSVCVRRAGFTILGPGGVRDTTGRVHWLERLVSVLSVLHGAGEGVTELSIDWAGYGDHAQFLPGLAVACPNVTSLQFTYDKASDPLVEPLPSWPKLKSLRLLGDGVVHAARFARLAPYITQLTTLQLPRPTDCSNVRWSALFSPPRPTTTITNTTINTPLTHFAADAQLTGELLRALLAHAPGLITLRVREVAVQSNAFRDRAWGVERVYVRRTPLCTLAGMRQALAALPRPREGHTQVYEDDMRVFEITDTQVRSMSVGGTAVAVMPQQPILCTASKLRTDAHKFAFNPVCVCECVCVCVCVWHVPLAGGASPCGTHHEWRRGVVDTVMP